MKKLFLTFMLLLAIFNLFSQPTGIFTDIRDGKTYKTIQLGKQLLMAENLAYKPKSGNFWVYGNDTSNIAGYGYLYDLETAQKIAPEGWHLPTKEEWEALHAFLGGDNDGVCEAMKVQGFSGFNALLAGYRSSDGAFIGLFTIASFWSSSAYNDNQAWYLECFPNYNGASLSEKNRACAFSVRLFKNN